MKPHRVLVLTAVGCSPPDNAQATDRFADWITEYDVTTTLKKLGHEVILVEVADDLSVLRKSIQEHQPHIVFMLLEEFNGICTYDYNMIGYLELIKMPYTGCNSRGLMLAKDKALSKKILSYHRVSVPKFFVVKKNHKPKMKRYMNFPCIVKSTIEDASLGISQASVVHNEEELNTRVEFIHRKIETDAIIEQFIEGRELYVGVLGNQRLQVLPVWELAFEEVSGSFQKIATSRVKWNKEYREKHQIKARKAKNISKDLESRLKKITKRAYKKLDLSGYARMDYRVTEDEKIYLIEANPNPGISCDDEFSESAKHLGYRYEELIAKILSLGFTWHEKRL